MNLIFLLSSSAWKRFSAQPLWHRTAGHNVEKRVSLIEKKEMWGVRLHYCRGLTDSEHVSHRTLFQEALKQEEKYR